MIGVVVVTHGRLAVELIAAAEHVVGEMPNVAAICVGPDDDIEARRADIQKAVEGVEGGAGVVILTDMFGGTPANLAVSLIKPGRVEVLAGANVPMLVKLAELREAGDLPSVAQGALAAGRKYIALASRVLNGDAP